ncbi:MAG: hypothetical protein R3C68_06320 [Myxococcota bacterium]
MTTNSQERALFRHLQRHDVTQADSYDAALRALAQLDTLDVVCQRLRPPRRAYRHRGAGGGELDSRRATDSRGAAPGFIPIEEARQVAHRIRCKTDNEFIHRLKSL